MTSDSLEAKGFFRLQVVEGDKVVGDSGWSQNTVTNLGKRNFLCYGLAGAAGSLQVGQAALGMNVSTTAYPAAAIALVSELTDAGYTRMNTVGGVFATSQVASNSIQFQFTLASNLVSTDRTIAEVGLFQYDASATATGGTLFAGNTFASSNLATNQAVNGTYEIRFS